MPATKNGTKAKASPSAKTEPPPTPAPAAMIHVPEPSQSTAFLAPTASVEKAVERYRAVDEFIKQILRPGVDYGIIPGATKPSLYKPGAEKMCAFFGLQVRISLEDRTEDWTGAEHGDEPFFNYRYKTGLYRGDFLIAEGEGSCNSWESKYRYRDAGRTCPSCGKATIIKGKDEYGGGWLCFGKKGGCGSKYPDGDQRIEGQKTGKIKNPDPADIVNTLQKMAQKRSLVAPVLIATNTSDHFTQDVEDMPHEAIDGQWRDAPNTAGAAAGTTGPSRPTAANKVQTIGPNASADQIQNAAMNLRAAIDGGNKLGANEFWAFAKAVPFDQTFATEIRVKHTVNNSTDWNGAVKELLVEYSKVNPSAEPAPGPAAPATPPEPEIPF